MAPLTRYSRQWHSIYACLLKPKEAFPLISLCGGMILIGHFAIQIGKTSIIEVLIVRKAEALI